MSSGFSVNDVTYKALYNQMMHKPSKTRGLIDVYLYEEKIIEHNDNKIAKAVGQQDKINAYEDLTKYLVSVAKDFTAENTSKEMMEIVCYLFQNTSAGKAYLSKLSTESGGGGSGSSEDKEENSKCREPIDPDKLKITFDDIAGQEETKSTIKQTYIYPIYYPNLFIEKTKGMLLYGPPGTGKCLHPEEKVIMFDGTIKESRYIKQGDLLMGDDSAPRFVLSTCIGEDEMFEIIPNKGESYKVNSPHIISLVSKDNEYIDIPLNEYLEKDDLWKSCYKGYRVSVDWPEQNLPFNPYDFGLHTKNIPQIYKINSRENRLQLIAGLLDSNGSIGKDGYFVFVSEEENLIDDIIFLSRSLGIYVEKSSTEPNKCFIHGDVEIPTKTLHLKSRKTNEDFLRYDFNVKSLGYGRYCGFELSGNHRFLLKDFTVSHNTLLAKATVAELAGKTAFFDPSPGEIKGSKHGKTEKNIDLLFTCAADVIGKDTGMVDANGNKITYDSAVIFIDEFEGIGGIKEGDNMMTLSVNALLQKMDGMGSTPGVSLIAATNFPWKLEEAILRRFTNRVLIDLPDEEARRFLLLEPLYKNFFFPLMDEDAKKKQFPIILADGSLNYGFLDELKELGQFNCSYNGEEDTYSIITQDLIEEFAGKLGPNKEGQALIHRIKNDEKYFDPGLQDLSSVKVGHSGSDISKIMDIAIRKAAMRALTHGYFKKVEIGDEKNYIYVSTPEFFQQSKNQRKRSKDLYTIHKDKANKDNINYIESTPEERKRIRNYSICKEDIEAAIKDYPSTIKTLTYLDVLNYRYHNTAPPNRN